MWELCASVPPSSQPSSKKAFRQEEGGSCEQRGKRAPVDERGVDTPARSAMVGAKSLFMTSCWRTSPAGTPGPRTIKGTPISSS